LHNREGHSAPRAASLVRSGNLSPPETRKRRGQQQIRLQDTPQPDLTWKRTYIRFQRTHPDTPSLWQTDIKYNGNRYLMAFLDDCSHYVPSAILCKHAATRRILKFLDMMLNRGRIPRQIVTDHGTQFYSEDGDIFSPIAAISAKQALYSFRDRSCEENDAINTTGR